MEKQIGLVLLNGAGLGSWIWDEIRPLLSHPVLAAEFPHRDRHKVPSKFRLSDYSNEVVRQIENWKPVRLLLVAHSIGGVVALQVAKHFGVRIAGMAGIAAVFPGDKKSFLSALPTQQRLITRLTIRLAGTRPPEKMIGQAYGTDLSQQRTDEIVRRFVAESPHLYRDRCEAPIPLVPKLYIKTERDAQFDDELQEKLATVFEAQHIESIASGHLPMLSKPKELAEMLNKFCDSL